MIKPGAEDAILGLADKSPTRSHSWVAANFGDGFQVQGKISNAKYPRQIQEKKKNLYLAPGVIILLPYCTWHNSSKGRTPCNQIRAYFIWGSIALRDCQPFCVAVSQLRCFPYGILAMA